VTRADADELSPQGAVARIGLSGHAGTKEVSAALGLGLAMAAAAGAPLRLADEVMDRVAVPIAGDDLLGPLLGHVPPLAQVAPGRGLVGWAVGVLPGQRPRFEPRNLDFADGLDRLRLPLTERAAVNDPDNNLVMISGDGDWTSHQVTVRVPEDSNSVIFGAFLAGPGRIEMRNAGLARAD
jgi:hypothetical protein